LCRVTPFASHLRRALACGQWRNERAGESGRPQAQLKEGAQETESWGKEGDKKEIL